MPLLHSIVLSGWLRLLVLCSGSSSVLSACCLCLPVCLSVCLTARQRHNIATPVHADSTRSAERRRAAGASSGSDTSSGPPAGASDEALAMYYGISVPELRAVRKVTRATRARFCLLVDRSFSRAIVRMCVLQCCSCSPRVTLLAVVSIICHRPSDSTRSFTTLRCSCSIGNGRCGKVSTTVPTPTAAPTRLRPCARLGAGRPL